MMFCGRAALAAAGTGVAQARKADHPPTPHPFLSSCSNCAFHKKHSAHPATYGSWAASAGLLRAVAGCLFSCCRHPCRCCCCCCCRRLLLLLLLLPPCCCCCRWPGMLRHMLPRLCSEQLGLAGALLCLRGKQEGRVHAAPTHAPVSLAAAHSREGGREAGNSQCPPPVDPWGLAPPAAA